MRAWLFKAAKHRRPRKTCSAEFVGSRSSGTLIQQLTFKFLTYFLKLLNNIPYYHRVRTFWNFRVCSPKDGSGSVTKIGNDLMPTYIFIDVSLNLIQAWGGGLERFFWMQKWVLDKQHERRRPNHQTACKVNGDNVNVNGGAEKPHRCEMALVGNNILVVQTFNFYVYFWKQFEMNN